MKRLPVALLLALGLVLAAAFSGAAGAENSKSCAENSWICTEVADSIGYGGEYTGHDEPSLLFYSDTPGAGNSNLYKIVLPTDPPQQPLSSGLGATWNFQLHPAFWLGMAMCETQSAPEYQHDTCAPDTDANKWCAALTIDSLSISYVDGTTQNPDCLNKAGPEPVSFAFITRNGVPHASPDPT